MPLGLPQAGPVVVGVKQASHVCEEPEVDESVRQARERVLKIPADCAWASDLADAFDRLRALHPA